MNAAHVDSVIYLEGYWRYSTNNNTGLVSLKITKNKGGEKILKGITYFSFCASQTLREFPQQLQLRRRQVVLLVLGIRRQEKNRPAPQLVSCTTHCQDVPLNLDTSPVAESPQSILAKSISFWHPGRILEFVRRRRKYGSQGNYIIPSITLKQDFY